MMEQFQPDRLIWSADVPKEDIIAVIEAEALPKGTIIKLDRLFFETESKDFVNYCQINDYPVFCDAKIIEIPDKALAIAKTYLTHKPFMLNIMAGACSTNIIDIEDEKKIDALKRFADICAEAGTRSCAVTVLTSKSPSMCAYEFSASPIEQVLKYTLVMQKAGITDIVCSPKEARAIREKSLFDMLDINTPGVRLPDSSRDDQQRVMTPHDALDAGATRLVIGRDLIRGEGDIVDRVKTNYQKIIEDIWRIQQEDPTL